MAGDLPVDPIGVDLILHEEGSHESDPVQVIGESFGFTALVDVSEHLDPGVELRLELKASVDGGKTWTDAGGMSRMGGAAFDPDGNPTKMGGVISKLSRGDGKFENLAGWTDPLIKQVVTLIGGSAKLSAVQCDSLPRTEAIEETHHSVSYANKASANGINATTVTTPAISSTSGNLLHADLSAYGAAGHTFSSLADSSDGSNYNLNTWSTANAEIGGSGSVFIRQVYAKNITGAASHTVKYTVTSGGYLVLGVLEIAGLDTAAPLGSTGHSTDNSGTTHSVSTSDSAPASGDIAIGFISPVNGTHTLAVGAGGYTDRNHIDSSGTIIGLLDATLIISSGGTQTFAPTTGDSCNTQVQIVTYKAAAGAGGAVLAGGATGVATAAGALSTGIPLLGAAIGSASAAGALTTQIPLAGAAAVAVSASGVLTTVIRLAGDAIAQAVAAGGLSTAIKLAAAAAAQAAAAGDLTGGSGAAQLAGDAKAQAAAAGDLTIRIVLSGAALANAAAQGALSTQIPLGGAAQVITAGAGALSTGIRLAGAAISMSSADGSLTVQGGLSAAAVAQAIAAGALTIAIQLRGAGLANVIAAGTLDYHFAPSPAKATLVIPREIRTLRLSRDV